MITKFKLFEDNEDNINYLLDKINKDGKDSLTQYELDQLKNKGDIPYPEIFTSGDIKFELDSQEDHVDVIVVKGTLIYNDNKYDGSFVYTRNDVLNYWEFYDTNNKEFEPEPDDFYQMDSLMQQIEDVLEINI